MEERRRGCTCCSESVVIRFDCAVRHGTETAVKKTQKEAACPERRYSMVSRDQSRSLQRVRRLQGTLQTRCFRTRSARSRRNPAPKARRGPPLQMPRALRPLRPCLHLRRHQAAAKRRLREVRRVRRLKRVTSDQINPDLCSLVDRDLRSLTHLENVSERNGGLWLL